MAAIYVAYCIYAFTRIQILDPLRSWAITMLIFCGIVIVVTIIVQILFHILLSVEIAVKETVTAPDVDHKKIGQTINNEFIEDERDKMVSQKSMQVGYVIRGGGLIAGLISLVLNAPPAVMLNIIFSAIFLGSVIEGIVTLIYYRKGFSNA
jgi:hypothetical protein